MVHASPLPLTAGPLIIERLREAVPALKIVSEHTDIDALEKNTAATPAALVIYDGYRVGDATGRYRAHVIDESWLVVIVVRNAARHGSGGGVLAETSPLLAATLDALSGWEPSGFHDPLALGNAPKPGFSAGFGYFPLLFKTSFEVVV